MNPTTLSDGEQLRVGILEYAQAKISELKRYIVFSGIIALFLSIITVLTAEKTSDIGGGIVVILVITTPIVGHLLFKGLYDGSGLYYWIQVKKLMDGSICYFGIDEKNKFIIIELFMKSSRMIDGSPHSKSLIESIFFTLLPQYWSRDTKTFVQYYAVPSIYTGLKTSIMDELEKIVDNELDRNSSNLPIDIKDKGKEMSRAYFMLYCIENTIRLFIESVEKTMDTPLFVTNSIRKKIADRKSNEAQNKYLSIRGNSDLFYLDFKELGDIIVNNPELLNFFPSENWVKVKIDELGNIRNLIAHNSYIGDLEIRIITANYESILRQMRK